MASDREPGKSGRPAWLGKAGIALAIVLVVALLGVMVKSFMTGGETKPRRMVQEIQLLKPPPPPPPPKPEEKPPEPEIKKEEVKVDDPKPDESKPADNEPPPALKNLGLDATGSGVGDSFGLLGNKGGTEITQTAGREEGPGGNGTGAAPEIKAPVDRQAFAYYTGRLQAAIQDALARNEKLQGSSYKLQVRIWLSASGAVQRVELGGSTGDPALDATLKGALGDMTMLAEAPPDDMPQPVRLRITSRL